LNIPLFQQPRTVWLPLKVTPEQTAFYVDLMKKVQATPEWKDYVEKSSQTQVFLTGKDFTDYMTQDSERVHKVAEEQGWLVK
ncbi:MAG TPA: tripartite tricarboxylate transporter substrate binding protein, partial [Reyranella sp.]